VKEMPKCAVCGEPSVAYAQLFRARKKVKSYPVCVSHGLLLYGFEQLGQDWGRANLARALGMKKGSILLVKVSLSP
jgi:hypothetical protein